MEIFFGLLFSFFFGLLAGNYATTLLYRLPRNIEICGLSIKNNHQPPCCSSCRHFLKFYEYLPLLSWFSTMGKCNYCGYKINPLYFFLEISTAAVAMINFLQFGFSEKYFLLVVLYTLSALSVALYWEHNKVFTIITFLMVILGGFNRVAIDGSIIPLLFNVSFFAIISMFLMQKCCYKDAMNILLPFASWIGFSYFLVPLIIVAVVLRKSRYIYPVSIAIFYCCVFIL